MFQGISALSRFSLDLLASHRLGPQDGPRKMRFCLLVPHRRDLTWTALRRSDYRGPRRANASFPAQQSPAQPAYGSKGGIAK